MKKDRIIIIILSIIFIICLIGLILILSYGREDKSLAKENKNFKITCNKDTIKKNEKVTCMLEGNIKEHEVSGISSTIEESDDFELIKVTPDSSWQGDGENGDVDLYTDENKKNKFKMFEFEISLKNEKTKEIEINITNNSYTDEKYEDHKLGDITKKIVIEK